MNRLREERVIRRVTQLILGLKAGMNQTKISYIENGLVEARQDEKLRLAKALQVRPERLFPENGDEVQD